MLHELIAVPSFCQVPFNCVDVPQFVCPVSCWRVSVSVLVLSDYKWSCYKQLCTDFCVRISFFFLWGKHQSAKSYGMCTFNFKRNQRVVLKSDCNILHSYQWMKIPVGLHPYQHLALSCFLILLTTLIRMQCYLTVVLICFFLRSNDVKLFSYTYLSSLYHLW